MSEFNSLRRRYLSAALDLEHYARRLRFSPSLLDTAAGTLLRSIEHGDGMLWSDSLLVHSLTGTSSELRSLFDRFPGFRTSLIANTEFADTLSTGRLAIQPSFQTPLNDALLDDLRYEGGVLSEERVLAVELTVAVEDYITEHKELSDFVGGVSAAVFDLASSAQHPGAALALRRMGYMLEDIVCLAMFSGTHPFAALSRSSSAIRSLDAAKVKRGLHKAIANTVGRRSFAAARRSFYWHLRDAATVSHTFLSDTDLENLSESFVGEEFFALCVEMDRQDQFQLRNPTVNDLKGQFLLAAARLRASELPIPLLIKRLSGWRRDAADASWPLSHKILLSIGEHAVRVEATHFDLGTGTGINKVDDASTKYRLAEVGIWTPSPVWSDTVLDRLAEMLSRHASEAAFQHLFEAYPDLILDELHVEAFPQVYMFDESSQRSLRPDFAIRRNASEFVDLVEIKRPDCKLLTGTSERPVLSRMAAQAVAQLLDYRRWFQDAGNRKWFRRQYGIEGLEPRLTLVIGRRPPPIKANVWSRALAGSEVAVLTYDDILERARARRKWML